MKSPSRHERMFASLEVARRVWAVGAVHADAERLRALHRSLETRLVRGDRLVYLGNYLGPGKDCLETLDELLAFRAWTLSRPGNEPRDIVYLRGAQEEMWTKLLQIQFATEPNGVLDWMLDQGVAAPLAAYGGDAGAARKCFREGTLAVTRWTGDLRARIHARPGHTELLGALRRAAYTEDGELLLVHAGVDPSRPVTEQGDTFWWGSGHFDEIDRTYCGFSKVIRGYDRAHRGVVIGAWAATIDGGCGFGGTLSAACFGLDGGVLDRIDI